MAKGLEVGVKAADSGKSIFFGLLPRPLPAPHHHTAITGTNRRLTGNRISYE